MPEGPVVFKVSDAASLGLAVREFRARRGMSQVRLSELAGIHRSYLSELEQGKTTEQLERLVRVLDRLGVRITLTAEP
ncbi:MAG: helix-turn-helix domain-containing protein [Acidimicrobiales bacterium]